MKRRELIVSGLALGVAGALKQRRVGAAEDAGKVILGGHVGPVSDVAFSPDGRWLASSSARFDAQSTYIGGETRLWDARAGKLARVLLPEIEGRSMQWSRDGRTLALPGMRWTEGAGEGSVQLWDASNADAARWELRHTLGEANAAAACALSPDSKYFVTGIDDRASGGAIVWDVDSGQIAARLSEQVGFLAASCFAPDGKTLVTVSWQHTAGEDQKFSGSALQWWDTSGVPEVWEMKRVLLMPERISDAALSPDGESLLWVRSDDATDSATLVVAEAQSGKVWREVKSEGWLISPRWSPDSRLVAVSHVTNATDRAKRRGQTQIFNARNWNISAVMGVGTRMISDLAFSPDGARLALSSGDKAVEIYPVL